MQDTDLTGISPDFQIVTERVLSFNRETCFRAWSDPQILKHWWGPHGFTNTFNEFDFRVGGRWRFVMHGPEKGNYANDVEFLKIEPPVEIVWKRHSQPYFTVRTTFEKIDAGNTRVIFRQIFDTVAACEKLRPYVTDKNEENFDRLVKELEKMH